MGEERLAELGIQRRGFLKKTAAAAFVAPAVVSFGLDGVADAASSRTQLNLFCNGNQTTTLSNVFYELGTLIAFTIYLLADGDIQNGNAQLIGNAATRILYALANKSKDVCEDVAGLLSAVNSARQNKRNNTNAMDELLLLAEEVSATLGCSCGTGLVGIPGFPILNIP